MLLAFLRNNFTSTSLSLTLLCIGTMYEGLLLLRHYFAHLQPCGSDCFQTEALVESPYSPYQERYPSLVASERASHWVCHSVRATTEGAGVSHQFFLRENFRLVVVAVMERQ